jgi:uncharacterized protein YegL
MARKKPVRAHALAPSDTQTPTIIEFILDETLSMNGQRGERKIATINGFNDFLGQQRGQPGLCLMTLTKFDSGRGQSTPYTDLDVNMVPDLRTETFLPGGSTNLKDTIVQRMTAVRGRISTWTVQPKVLLVIMTDGEDNCSKFTDAQVRQTITDTMERDQWAVVYLGAHSQALSVAMDYGIPSGNAKQFTDSEIRSTMSDLSAATKAYRATATTSSSDFFHAAAQG